MPVAEFDKITSAELMTLARVACREGAEAFVGRSHTNTLMALMRSAGGGAEVNMCQVISLFYAAKLLQFVPRWKSSRRRN